MGFGLRTFKVKSPKSRQVIGFKTVAGAHGAAVKPSFLWRPMPVACRGDPRCACWSWTTTSVWSTGDETSASWRAKRGRLHPKSAAA